MLKASKSDTKKRGGRQKFVPTAEELAQVEAMAGFGVPYSQMCRLVRGGIDKDVFAREFKDAAEKGKAKASTKIGQTLFQQAINGNIAAAIFWAKTQMGWREGMDINHRSGDGSMSPKPAVDVSMISTEALIELVNASQGD